MARWTVAGERDACYRLVGDRFGPVWSGSRRVERQTTGCRRYRPVAAVWTSRRPSSCVSAPDGGPEVARRLAVPGDERPPDGLLVGREGVEDGDGQW